MEGSATDMRKLLIVDDDADWTEVLRLFFSEKYMVRIANSAEDAIESIRFECPSVIILDLVMPSIDGFGLMQRLNDMSATRIPTVLTTGWESQEVQMCAESVGCAAVLAKPVSLVDLDKVVRSLMQGSDRRRVAQELPADD